jgi:hypothetical protein
MRVKPEHEQTFLDINRNLAQDLLDRLRQNGLRQLLAVKTGDLSYCLLGEWETFDSIVASRLDMIGQLDQMRHMLEDLGGDLGVTDPVSGEVVLQLDVAAPPARRATRSGAGKARSTKTRTQSRKAATKPRSQPRKTATKPRKTASREVKRPGRTAAKPASGKRPAASKRQGRTGRR